MPCTIVRPPTGISCTMPNSGHAVLIDPPPGTPRPERRRRELLVVQPSRGPRLVPPARPTRARRATARHRRPRRQVGGALHGTMRHDITQPVCASAAAQRNRSAKRRRRPRPVGPTAPSRRDPHATSRSRTSPSPVDLVARSHRSQQRRSRASDRSARRRDPSDVVAMQCDEGDDARRHSPSVSRRRASSWSGAGASRCARARHAPPPPVAEGGRGGRVEPADEQSGVVDPPGSRDSNRHLDPLGVGAACIEGAAEPGHLRAVEQHGEQPTARRTDPRASRRRRARARPGVYSFHDPMTSGVRSAGARMFSIDEPAMSGSSGGGRTAPPATSSTSIGDAAAPPPDPSPQPAATSITATAIPATAIRRRAPPAPHRCDAIELRDRESLHQNGRACRRATA